MKKRLLLILSTLFLLFSLASCELFYAEPAKGKMRILVMGCNYNGRMYDSVKGGLHSYRKLTCTVNDAVDMGIVLSSYAKKAGLDYEITYAVGTFATEADAETALSGVDTTDSHVTVSYNLLGADADYLSLDYVQSILTKAKEEAGDNDTFVFYYSGHGDYDGTKRVYLDYGTDTASLGCLAFGTGRTTPLDSTPYYYSLTYWKFSDILDRLEAIPGKKVMMLDSCYSGCAVESDGFTVSNELYNENPWSLLSKEVSVRKNVFVLSASQYYEESQEPYRSHGYFTSFLLEALGYDGKTDEFLSSIPAESDKRVTLAAIAAYIKENSEGSAAPISPSPYQKVQLSGGSQDLVLFDFN